MATYIQGLYDSPLAITPFSPDYSLLQNVLKTKEMEYERGFAQVKNIYNSLLTAEATNAEDKEAQKAYIAEAEEKLKNLASVDLSLDQNVSVANSVFKPFQEDQELLYDISVTKISKQQLGVGQSFLTSDDDKKRKMHSSISDEFVTIPLDELRRAKRGDGSITAVKPRYYVPAVNLYDKFKDFLKAGDYDAVIETSNGSGLILRQKGGKRVEVGLYNLMNGLLTGDERKYFDAWGEVLYNRGVNDYMSRGFTLDQSRKELAADFYQRDLSYFTTQRDNTIKDRELIKAKLEEYRKREAIQGGLSDQDNADAASLIMTDKQYEQSLSNLNTKIRDLTSPATMQAERDKYYNGKSGILSSQLLDQSLRSISSAMGTLTESREYKADEYYWKKLEHALNIEKLEVEKLKVQADLMKAEGGSSGGGPNAKTGGKLTEAEKKLIEANRPIDAGTEKVPESKEGQLLTFWENMNQNFNGMVENGVKASEEVLGSTFNSGNTTIGNLLRVVRDKKLNNQFSDEAVEFISKADTPETRAFKRFNELYNTAASGQKSEFQTYLEEAGKKTGDKVTYGDVYGFLLGKTTKTFNDLKSAMPTDQYMRINGYFNRIAKGNELNEIFQKDQKSVESQVLTNISNVIKKAGYDESYLIVTDDDGFRRLKGKGELQAELANYQADNPVVGTETYPTYAAPSAGAGGGVREVRKHEKQIWALQKILGGIDNITKEVNGLVSDALSANKFTLDDKTLSSFRAYSLQDYGDTKGEIAEQAIARLLSNDILIMSGNPSDAVDLNYYKGRGGVDDEAVKGVINELATSAKTTGNAWNNSVEYRQFSGDRGDKRKSYVIKFDAGNIDQLITKYSKEATMDGGKQAVLQKIKQEGLVIKTSEPIPGGLGLYGIIERFNQANGFIESPKGVEDLYKYRVDKTSDNNYVLSSDSYYIIANPTTGAPTKLPLSGLEFPQGASFQSISELLDGFIKERILSAQTQLQRNIQNGPKKLTLAELEKQLRGQ
jgi:hypothetical protein